MDLAKIMNDAHRKKQEKEAEEKKKKEEVERRKREVRSTCKECLILRRAA